MTYWDDMEKSRAYWDEYAQNVLINPNATEYECKTAIIGVRGHNRPLAEKLKAKKPKKVKLS